MSTNVSVIFTVPLSTPEVPSPVRMPKQQQTIDDVTASLRRPRDQDDDKRGSSTTGLSLRLATLAPMSGLDAHRRRRTAFTSDQLLELEKEFHSKKYLSLTERSQLAHDLQLSEVCHIDVIISIGWSRSTVGRRAFTVHLQLKGDHLCGYTVRCRSAN